MNVRARQKIAHLLIWIAAWIHPCRPGYCFVRNLHSGWAIIDGCLIRQSVCEKPLKGIEWETWTLPEQFWTDLKKESKCLSN